MDIPSGNRTDKPSTFGRVHGERTFTTERLLAISEILDDTENKFDV